MQTDVDALRVRDGGMDRRSVCTSMAVKDMKFCLDHYH